MSNISRAMGGARLLTDSPTLKIIMMEYEDMAIKVGDKITIEIKKSDSSSWRYVDKQDVYYRMDSTFLILIGGVVLAILFISYYLIPNVICEALRKNISQGTPQNAPSTLNDPINGICSAFGR